MNYALSLESFFVNEIFNPALGESGRFYYYILEKKNISHSLAVKKIGVKAWFCGIKDKNATTKQWFCTEEKVPEMSDDNFKVKFKGCSDKRIHIGMHKGNAFKIIIELSKEETDALKHFYPKKELVCNYFGEQRFGSNLSSFSNALEEKNFEAALKIFLTQKSKHDTQKSTVIKKLIEENWGNWEKIAQHSEVKGTKKIQLFEFLTQHPKEFEKAFKLVEPKSLRIMLKACQAMRFNKELNLLARNTKPKNIYSQITGQCLECAEYALSASKAFKRIIEIKPSEFEKNFRKNPLERKTFFKVEKFRAKKIADIKFELSFELGRGEYATIFLKFLQCWLADKINKGFCSN